MANKIKLHIPTKEFKLFLKSISKITESIIIKLKDKKMEVLTTSEGGNIIMLSSFILPDEGDNNIDLELPINDISKLLKICDFAIEETIILEINDNLIKYKNDYIRLKFYLAEKSIIPLPPQVTPDKFRAFPISFSIKLNRDKLIQLEKGFSFVRDNSGNTKVYFYVEDGVLYGELTDYQSDTTDSFRVSLGTDYTGQLIGRIPIKFDVWTLLDYFNDEVIFDVSVVKRKSLTYNILFIRQLSENLEHNYLIQSLKN